MRNDDQKTSLILCACGILPVVWLALLTAPYVSGGLIEIIRGLPVAMGNPFEITMCEDSVKTVLIFCLPTIWLSVFISPHAGTTAGVRNTALQNGATSMH